MDSVLNQSFKEFEIIVVDDGSTDGGGDWVKEYYGDQIWFISKENQGVSSARNIGISKASFPYVVFLDADDYWEPNFLFWIKETIKSYPDLGIVGSGYTTDEKTNHLNKPEFQVISDYFKIADYNTLFTSSSTVIRKDFFDHNIGFKEHIVKGEDLDVWFRAIAYFGTAYYVNAPLVHYDTGASEGSIQIPNFNRTVFSEIYNDNFLPKEAKSWAIFRDKFVLLNAWIFFADSRDRKEGIALIQRVQSGFNLAKLPYHLPKKLMEKIVISSQMKSWLRYYLKFCFRYIYT